MIDTIQWNHRHQTAKRNLVYPIHLSYWSQLHILSGKYPCYPPNLSSHTNTCNYRHKLRKLHTIHISGMIWAKKPPQLLATSSFYSWYNFISRILYECTGRIQNGSWWKILRITIAIHVWTMVFHLIKDLVVRSLNLLTVTDHNSKVSPRIGSVECKLRNFYLSDNENK